MQHQDPGRTATALPERAAGAMPVPAQATIRASDLPLAEGADPVALALILRTEGPSYRPVGATMALASTGAVAGTLSSGCIDADIAEHAKAVAGEGVARRLRYGAGSPFIDLTLPCGGGLDILVLPAPPAAVRAELRARLAAREPFSLAVSGTGLTVGADPRAELLLRVLPDPRFAVFGKGPEAVAFARMVAGAGYETVLASPDTETLAPLDGRGATVVHLPQPSAVAQVPLDAFTAGVLFFHDHDWEPAILRHLLASRAFYVGAQGSRRTAENRLARLRAAGVAEADLARLRGPIGVIPSTRDARTLAASVLAEVLAEAVVAG